jgi:hydrogenase/urease accessory protein HupE
LIMRRYVFCHAMILSSGAAMLPNIAQAHVDAKSFQLIAGVVHPWINLDSGFTLAALVLWLCQAVKATDLLPFILIAAGLVCGDGAGIFLAGSTEPLPIEIVTLALALSVTFRYLPARPVWIMGLTFAAFLSGWYAGCDAARDITSPTLFLIGVLSGGLIIPLSTAMLMAERRSAMLHVGARVLGSWIATIDLMLLALRLKA